MMQSLSLMIKPVSGACNMRCRYCFYADEMKVRQTAVYPKMSIETLEKLVRRAIQCAEYEVMFAFQGGEPTLAGLGFYEKLIEFQNSYNTKGLIIHNSVQTNGYDIDDKLIEFFAKNNFLLGLSLDGNKQIHDMTRLDNKGSGTYDRIKATAEKLEKAGVEYNILCVVNDYVASEPEKVFYSLADYGYIQFINCLDGFDGEKQEWSLKEENLLNFNKKTFDCYYEAFKKGRPVSVRNFDNYVRMIMGYPPESCAMTGSCGQYFLIEGDGSVYPCDFYCIDKYLLGNINDTTFSRLLNNKTGRDFISESMPVPEKCGKCKWYKMCRNGCRRERGGDNINIHCKVQYEFFEYAYERMVEMAKSVGK